MTIFYQRILKKKKCYGYILIPDPSQNYSDCVVVLLTDSKVMRFAEDVFLS